jgi:hypothetical protein
LALGGQPYGRLTAVRQFSNLVRRVKETVPFGG